MASSEGDADKTSRDDEEPIDIRRGKRKTVTTHGDAEDDPEPGETVRRKTIGGHETHTVAGTVEKEDHDGNVRTQVELEDGRTVYKNDLVEYTAEEDWEVVEMPDGSEVYLAPVDSEEVA